MLKGISPVIFPELLKVLAEMGHGDEIVFADAHFPAHYTNPYSLRADGVSMEALFAGLVPLFELDSYEVPVIMMAPVGDDVLDPGVEASFRKALNYEGEVLRISREEFYERTKTACAVVATGTTAQYANVILKKGVTPLS